MLTKDRPVVEEKLITAAEFYEMVELGRAELVNGEVVQLPPPSFFHGLIENRVAKYLSNFVDEYGLGYVLTGEAGVLIGREPDTVRGVDVAFISQERMEQVSSDATYLDVMPELVVEVVSPNERWADIAVKLEQYFAAGALQVWLVEFNRRVVYIYQSATESRKLSEGDVIEKISFLDGFMLPVKEIFAVLPS